MAGYAEMLRGVLVFRLVAAADVAAAQTGAEMDPTVAEGDALVADGGGGIDWDYRGEMRAGHTARGRRREADGARQTARGEGRGLRAGANGDC